MSEERHLFHLKSVWTGNSDGDGRIIADTGSIDYGVPALLGGKAGRSNPEEMLLAAVASCYSITFALLAERRSLPVTEIHVEAQGAVERQPDRSLKFTSIRLHTRIRMEGADETQRKATLEASQRAEKYCLISRALQGNVEIVVEPELIEDSLG
jgi:peroxiredoxin-like protein